MLPIQVLFLVLHAQPVPQQQAVVKARVLTVLLANIVPLRVRLDVQVALQEHTQILLRLPVLIRVFNVQQILTVLMMLLRPVLTVLQGKVQLRGQLVVLVLLPQHHMHLTLQHQDHLGDALLESMSVLAVQNAQLDNIRCAWSKQIFSCQFCVSQLFIPTYIFLA